MRGSPVSATRSAPREEVALVTFFQLFDSICVLRRAGPSICFSLL